MEGEKKQKYTKFLPDTRRKQQPNKITRMPQDTYLT